MTNGSKKKVRPQGQIPCAQKIVASEDKDSPPIDPDTDHLCNWESNARLLWLNLA